MMARTGSLNTQNPDAYPGKAWCSPPEMLNAASTWSDASISAASREAPVDRAAASYIPS